MIRAALTLVAVLSISSCSDTPSKSDCEKLLDHVVALELENGGGEAVKKELADEIAEQKERVIDYVSKDFMETCIDDLPKSQLECGLKAKSMSQLFECDKS